MRVLSGLGFCAWLLIFLGCNTAGLSPVTGQVLLDGNPLPNASIQFVPQENGRDATGATDAEGKFTMSTNEPRDGVLAGKYKVVIIARPPVQTQTFATADEAMRAAAVAKPPPSSNLLPLKYTRADQTPLTIEVPLKEKPLLFQLKSTE